MVNGWWWRCGNGTPCKACRDREGQFFPLSVPFQQIHDNCVCYPELSEVADPDYSEIVPEEEIPGLQRISFETNEPAPEPPQMVDEDLRLIKPTSSGAGLGEMRQIPTIKKDENLMNTFQALTNFGHTANPLSKAAQSSTWRRPDRGGPSQPGASYRSWTVGLEEPPSSRAELSGLCYTRWRCSRNALRTQRRSLSLPLLTGSKS